MPMGRTLWRRGDSASSGPGGNSMEERFLRISADAEKKQEEQFRIWGAGEGIPFQDAGAKAAYQDRVGLIKDAIQLRQKPRRIPICPSAGFFPMEYAGVTMYDAMYDYGTLKKAWVTYHLDFEPDAYSGPTNIVPGRVLDTLDLKLYEWPGHGVPKEREYQFVEQEYMKEEEYQDLIDDPTAFFLNVYFPRIFGSLKPFATFPLLPLVNEIPAVPAMASAFGTEGMKSALESLCKAGEEA